MPSNIQQLGGMTDHGGGDRPRRAVTPGTARVGSMGRQQDGEPGEHANRTMQRAIPYSFSIVKMGTSRAPVLQTSPLILEDCVGESQNQYDRPKKPELRPQPGMRTYGERNSVGDHG